MQQFLGLLLMVAVSVGGYAIGSAVFGSTAAGIGGAAIAFWVMVAVIAKEKTGRF